MNNPIYTNFTFTPQMLNLNAKSLLTGSNHLFSRLSGLVVKQVEVICIICIHTYMLCMHVELKYKYFLTNYLLKYIRCKLHRLISKLKKKYYFYLNTPGN